MSLHDITSDLSRKRAAVMCIPQAAASLFMLSPAVASIELLMSQYIGADMPLCCQQGDPVHHDRLGQGQMIRNGMFWTAYLKQQRLLCQPVLRGAPSPYEMPPQ